MNERLNTRDLAELLANQTGLDQKRAEKFIDVFSSHISQGIERNKIVKMLGFGTFKIVLVRERESVHIQTGERFVIPAHHKLSFVPDKGFKEQINRPFAFLEPVEAIEKYIPKKVSFKKENKNNKVDDPVNEQDESINPVVIMDGDDYNNAPEDTKNIPVVSEGQEVFEHEKLSEVVDVPVVEAEDSTVEEDEELAPVHDEPKVAEGNVVYMNAESEESGNDKEYRIKTTEKKKKLRSLLWFLLLPLLVIIGSGIATYAFLYYNYDKASTREQRVSNVSEQNPKTAADSPMPIGLTATHDDGSTASFGEYELIDEFLPDSVARETGMTVGEDDNNSEADISDKREERKVIDWLAPSSEKSNTETKRADRPNEKIESKNRELTTKSETKTTPATTSNNKNTASNATAENASKAASAQSKEKVIPSRVRMTAGSSLTQIAMEYYGDKVFWVYIYEHNKSRIKNFNNIPVGTEIRLPLPKTYGINVKSKSSIDKAKQKQSQLLRWDNWDDYKQ